MTASSELTKHNKEKLPTLKSLLKDLDIRQQKQMQFNQE